MFSPFQFPVFCPIPVRVFYTAVYYGLEDAGGMLKWNVNKNAGQAHVIHTSCT